MFKNIFLKKNRLPCDGCTKCKDVGNRVRSIIILKEYSLLQGTHHSCIKQIPTSVILHRLFILLFIVIGFCSLVYFIT